MMLNVTSAESRKTPRDFEHYRALAYTLGLPHPEGRAIYACNRKRNGWPLSGDYCSVMSDEDFLRRTKDATAERWWRHFESGGSIEVLSMSSDERRKWRNDRRTEHLRRNARRSEMKFGN